MAIDVKKPSRVYMDYDVTESGYDMKKPYDDPPLMASKPVAAAAYVMVVLCALIIITWLANTIAWWIS